MLIKFRPSTYVKGSNVNLGSFGVTGVTMSFSLKCYNSSMLHSKLHSMTIRLIHVDQLETIYLCYVVKISIWGHLGSRIGQGSCRSNDTMAFLDHYFGCFGVTVRNFREKFFLSFAVFNAIYQVHQLFFATAYKCSVICAKKLCSLHTIP